jgi:hypothetical protein
VDNVHRKHYERERREVIKWMMKLPDFTSSAATTFSSVATNAFFVAETVSK